MIKKGLIFEERECQREKKADARYARQIDQFAQYETDKISRFHFQEKLRSASVVIIGVGGLGSWIAANLTMAGIGTITLVDGDHVELSNLNRQILYHEGDLGRPKAEAAKEALEKINDDVQFKCIQSYVSSQSCAEKILSECPGAIVVLAADEPLLKLRAWVADACLKMGSKLIMVASGGIGPLIIPNHETPCWECQKKYLESLYPEVENWMQELDAPSRNGLPQPIMPGYHSMMAGLLTTEMIKLITSIQEPNTLGTILAWQPGTSTVVQEKIFRHPECVNHPEEA
ncbi:hypothetical protein BSZ40_10590 [Buchananella hordeovulneris]|uniref:THIF-type NAD/FAD binding fold domain-containing protein n=2 Tax=Buchananella hordeovulneris TaxID=52770 RepID=A0A1Q5PTE5_9ACTO|nr:hypothetical protein BSZ40_10590 [Buchananella hordeovulneris]